MAQPLGTAAWQGPEGRTRSPGDQRCPSREGPHERWSHLSQQIPVYDARDSPIHSSRRADTRNGSRSSGLSPSRRGHVARRGCAPLPRAAPAAAPPEAAGQQPAAGRESGAGRRRRPHDPKLVSEATRSHRRHGQPRATRIPPRQGGQSHGLPEPGAARPGAASRATQGSLSGAP